MSTPIERLRALHKPCVMPCFDHAWVGDRQHCAGPHCLATWPCDTVAALDALEEGLHQLLDARPSRGQLMARLGAATGLIRQAMRDRHYSIRPYPDNEDNKVSRCGSPLGTSIDTCPDCAPYREWLAGDKEENSES